MEHQPEVAPVPPAHSGVPPQPVAEPNEAFSESWLEEREHSTLAEHVDRLAEDYNLVTMLALGGFTGRDYEYFETELAKYGLAVISSWLRRGVIFSKCRQRGFGGLPEPAAGTFDDPDTVAGLANETVAHALQHFHSDILLKNRWDYRRGASLRTYFVGQCLIRFANVYRRWWNTEYRGQPSPADMMTLDALDRRHQPSVEDLVVDEMSVDRALRAIKNPRVRRALVYRGAGYTHAEIAERLGTTEKAVERMLAYERHRLRRRGIA